MVFSGNLNKQQRCPGGCFYKAAILTASGIGRHEIKVVTYVNPIELFGNNRLKTWIHDDLEPDECFLYSEPAPVQAIFKEVFDCRGLGGHWPGWSYTGRTCTGG
jgi:hypothetical protein